MPAFSARPAIPQAAANFKETLRLMLSVGVDQVSCHVALLASITRLHSIAPVYMSPENVHKRVGFYMEVLILGVIL